MGKKIGFGLCGVLAILLALGLCYQMGVRKGVQSSQANGTQETVAAAEGESVNSATEEVSEAEQESSDITSKGQASGNLKLELATGNGWEADGGYAVQIDGTITNAGSEDVNDWSAQVTVPKGTTVTQGWNGEYKVSGTVLKVTPADYNAFIPVGQNTTFGLIINTPKMNFEAEEGKVFVEGEQVGQTEQDANQTENADSTAQNSETETVADTTNGSVKYTKESNPVKKHGKLRVQGRYLVDRNGKKFQLRGISTHGIAWFPQYVNKQSFASLKSLYGINAVRLAMYSDPGAGYSKAMHEKVKEGVKAATELGLYVIIDWHILSDGNPNQYKKQAKAFFKEMSGLYKNQKNVIYEICNEPNGNVTWQGDIKPYANTMIKTIRKKDKDAIIIVGTPTWSQDVDVVAQSPIKGQKNIMYALHFYAATHKENLISKAQTALNKKLPLFVSEFSICDASGSGGIDYASANAWKKFLNKNKISMMAWSLCNKNETAALLKPNCNKTKGYKKSDLSKTGKWLLKAYR